MRHSEVHYDATLDGADAAFALLIGLLRRLSADEATEWIVLGDGAPWIWDRIEHLASAVGFDMSRVTQVLDFYHAVRRIVNLRLKGNGIFWCPRNAEAVLHLRAQLLSGTWNDFVSAVLQHDVFWGDKGQPLHAAHTGQIVQVDQAA